MPFNSFTFVLFFFAVVLVHSLPLPRIVRKLNLLIASYLFYAAWEPWFVTLLVYATAINWAAGDFLQAWDSRPGRRKMVLWSAVVLNIGLLAAFKYGNEFLSLWQPFATRLRLPSAPPTYHILLPIGLSFFTFQSLSYTIDVYRRDIKPATSFIDFALFVAFFPVLLAGPLLRAGQFLPQCARIRRATGPEFGWGLSLFTLGLFLKVTLADHLLAPVVRQIFDVSVRPDSLSAWTGTLAFAGQDYCDFAGYSTCAMGIGYCLGFVLPPNFRAPLASIGFRDVWQRWHITLVAWLRDYVFNALGGVYKGYLRAAINVMIVMLLIGLWHGASWTFLMFGFLHGTYLIGETFLQRTRLRRWQIWNWPLGKLFLWATTIALCLVAFVFYRAASLEQSLWMLSSMFGRPQASLAFRLSDTDLMISAIVLEGLIIAHWLCRNTPLEAAVVRVPWWSVSVGLALMLVAITLSSGESQGFLYFAF
jgi:alginate O-acetyltransferase complex protein AlgI